MANADWLRDARWGLFTHFLVHKPSHPVPDDVTPSRWNARVDGFDATSLARQLLSLKVPYFFITVGQDGGYYCSPNQAYARQAIGPPADLLSRRDLILDLARVLGREGIRQCVYVPGIPGLYREHSTEWFEVVAEWSNRWGAGVHAWWIDGSGYTPDEYRDYTAAMKAGNPSAIVAYNTGPVGMNRDQLQPATEHEDYLAGEVDYVLPTCGVRGWDGAAFYASPWIGGDQLHFLNFLGEWWSTGSPRFADELVIAWTRHINDHGGAVTWDLPLTPEGGIPPDYYRQIDTLSRATR